MGKLYAVRIGRVPGIYTSWEECRANTDGYPSAEFKSFKTAGEAAAYMGYTGEPEACVQNTDAVSGCGRLTAYVDGSYNTLTKEYGYGAVLLSDDCIIAELCGKGADEEMAAMRNVAGEIQGAEAAMRYALEKGYSELAVYHDYEGIAKWCLGEWKTNKTGTKAYKKAYDSIATRVSIEFVKVKGHSGDKYNDMADTLAKKAAGILQE